MSFMEAVKSVFSKYATFSGRARRSEYWYFYLFNFIVSLIISALVNISEIFSFVSGIYSLAILIPSLAVMWRRFHDIGKSGAWFLICLIPLVGWIIFLVWMCKDSQIEENQYGPSPKYAGAQSYGAPVYEPSGDPWGAAPEAPKSAPPASEDDEFSKLLKSFKDSE